MSICFLYVSCSSVPPSPPSTEGNGNSEAKGGGGRKGGWGIYYRGFFPGDLCKIGELFINNSFSVEQATSYFAVTGLPFRRAKTPISCDRFINHPDLTTKMLSGNNKYICFFFQISAVRTGVCAYHVRYASAN